MGGAIYIKVLGLGINIGYSIVIQWIIMILIILFTFFITANFKELPAKKQILTEYVVESIEKLVKENMGEAFVAFIPFVGTLIIFLTLLNLTGLLGLKPPTTDYSVTLGLGLISFFLIHTTAVLKRGIGDYIIGYFKPYWFMMPLNIIERAIVPVSLSLRLFGNITAGTIVVELIYKGLKNASALMHLNLPLLQIIIPIPFHIYFDVFDGIIQSFIFAMLTMIFIKTTSEH